MVDNDNTATRLVEAMVKEKAGRVTFMPLNRLKSHTFNYPKANDALPMISKLKFDRAYVMAFEEVSQSVKTQLTAQVFGRTIICEDLPTAAQYSRSHNLNAVTVEGDRADRKGALSGGYHDVRRSRMDAVKGVKKWREAYDTDAARLAEIKDEVSRLEQEISTTMGRIQVIEAKRKQILDGRAMISSMMQSTSRDEEESRKRVERLESLLNDGESELRAAVSKRESYEEEMRTPMRQTLTNAEVQRLEQLTQEAETQKAALLEAAEARQKVRLFVAVHTFTNKALQSSSDRSELEIELTENLRRRRDDLRGNLDDLEGDAGAGVLQVGEVDLRNSELQNLVRSIERLTGQVEGKSLLWCSNSC